MRRTGLLALLLVLAGCGGGGERSSQTPKQTVAVTVPAAQPGATGACPVTGKQVSIPKLGPGSNVTVTTNVGVFTFVLDIEDSPCTTASFAALVRKGFFDGTRFHRIVPGFVIQGGDPTGTGRGGPGYSVVDVPPADARYTRGVVAMAKTGAEPPGTSGSQLFVVTGSDAGLPPEYALLGSVTKGLAVVERIGKLGDPQTEEPTRKVVVHTMRLGP